VGSAFDALRAGGLFSVSSFTKLETTRQLLSVMRQEVDRMRERGPTQAEVEKAQRYLAGLFPLRTETNESLAAVLADMALYGLGGRLAGPLPGPGARRDPRRGPRGRGSLLLLRGAR
jgi:zinc protease